MEKIREIINKVTNVLAAVVGTLQLALPVAKELLVTLTRISGSFFFWTDVDERVIGILNGIYSFLDDNVEKFKNIILSIGKI